MPKPTVAKRYSVSDGYSGVMTLHDVARYLRCHESTVYRLIKAGKLEHIRLGVDYRFLPEHVERFIKAATVTG